MPLAPQQYQPQVGYQPNPQLQALQSVIQAIRNQAGSGSQQPWGFHEPTQMLGESIAPILQGAWANANEPKEFDPTGSIGGVTRIPGWGPEVLRRYKLLGGTPETLRRTLTNRAVPSGAKDQIVDLYRKGTDLAAPPHYQPNSLELPPWHTASSIGRQKGAMDAAGDDLQQFGFRRDVPRSNPRVVEEGSIPPDIESGTSGNAAYGALSRQVSRMLDNPAFQLLKNQRGSFNPGFNFRRVPDLGTDAGGYQASINSIRQALGVPKPNRYLDEVPGGDEIGLRKDYFDNITGLNALHDLAKGGPRGDNTQNYESAQKLYSYLTPQGVKAADTVQLGRQALEQELLRQSILPSGGGGIPSEAMLRRFGFGGNVGEYPGIPRWQHYNKPQ